MSPLEFRAKLGLTQREMAVKIGISQPAIAWLESGARSPSARVATKYEKLSKGRVKLSDFPAIKGAA
jgi:transcriptional regulator with XRE-family HTH domain